MRHLHFEALDLVALDTNDRPVLFAQLCDLHRLVGARTNMGLGAYFDPDELQRNPRGRFHIDAAGYRSWGFSYTSATSPCRRLLALK